MKDSAASETSATSLSCFLRSHASVRGHPLQQYRLAPTYAVQYTLVASGRRLRQPTTPYVCHSRMLREQCAQHSTQCPLGSRDDSVTGGAPAFLAAERRREIVGNAAGVVSDSIQSALPGVCLSRSVVLLAQDSLSP